MHILTRWLDWMRAKPVIAALATGVLLLAASPRASSAAGGGSGETLSDERPAIGAPFLRAVAPLRVDAAPRVQRRAVPHDDTIAAAWAEPLPIVSFTQAQSSPSSRTRVTAPLFVRGYDATAPPRLLK